jgi:hypothetical protein
MLSKPQQKAISLLVNGATHEKAASASGVSTRTIIRWKKIPEFQKALLEAQNNQEEIVVSEVKRLTSETTIQELYPQAIIELSRILNSSEREANKLKAIQILFSKLPELKPSHSQEGSDRFPIEGIQDTDEGSDLLRKPVEEMTDEELNEAYNQVRYGGSEREAKLDYLSEQSLHHGYLKTLAES